MSFLTVKTSFAMQGVSQKFLIWAVKPKLEISELWSRGVWGTCSEGPQWFLEQSSGNIDYLALIESI